MTTKKPLNAAQQVYQQMRIGSGDNWDELANGQEEKIKAIIAKSSTGIAQATADVEAAGMIDEEFDIMARGTMNDLRDYASRFQALVARRNGRTGPTKNDTDYTDYINLGIEYVALDQEMAVVLPVGLFGLAEYQARADRKLSALNKDVVTDVEAKEV